jgi:hypothetical protein
MISWPKKWWWLTVWKMLTCEDWEGATRQGMRRSMGLIPFLQINIQFTYNKLWVLINSMVMQTSNFAFERGCAGALSATGK